MTTTTLASMTLRDPSEKMPYFYQGGLASIMACCCTHPIDLIKVHLQTSKTSHGMSGQAKLIFNMYGGGVPGVRAFYSGLTASMGRQLTYSATRFAVYDYLKSVVTEDKRNLTGLEKMGIAMSAGAIGGVFGTPCDLVNVRMQSDSKLKIGDINRRNYGNVVKGLNHIYKTEGTKVLMNGWEMATIRASFMTLGQIAMYEVFKETAVNKLNAPDITPTHLFCSAMAGVCGAAFTMPFDVMKTRMMNATPGTYSSPAHCFKVTLSQGGNNPLIFYSGFGPAAVRIIPQTVLTWVFKEQLRLNCGYFPAK